jgi:hypothetical protein
MTLKLVPIGPNRMPTTAEHEHERAQQLDTEHLDAIQKGELRVSRRRRPKIGKAVLEKFCDGKWHSLDAIVEEMAPIEASFDHVKAMVEQMRWRATYNTRCERKYIGGKPYYRMFSQEKLVSIGELTDKLGPLIAGLKVEGKKNMATISISKVAIIAVQLERQLKEWSK